jgi:hypothetical protein
MHVAGEHIAGRGQSDGGCYEARRVADKDDRSSRLRRHLLRQDEQQAEETDKHRGYEQGARFSPPPWGLDTGDEFDR